MSCTKVCILGPRKWALASLHAQLAKELRKYYDVYCLDWSNSKQVSTVYSEKFDVIIAEAGIMELSDFPLKEKLIPIFHHMVLELNGVDSFDSDHSKVIHEFKNIHGINDKICEEVFSRYGVQCRTLPFGISDNVFPERKLRPIKNIGHVINPNGDSKYYETKGNDKINAICSITGLDKVVVFGKSYLTGTYIYSEADMVVCASKSEGIPTPFLECASAKIPFISTKVGIVNQYKSVKTFDTPEEASEIINWLRSDARILKRYVDGVYDEVISDRNIESIVKKYWIPVIEKIAKK